MTSAPRLLIVDDDPEITSALARGLALHGYAVETLNRAESALIELRDPGYSAAIIDVMIGPDSGIDLVRAARAAGARMPILMLSALSEVEDRAAGLEAGADDYIVKPFSFDELTARLKVQESRAAATRPAPARLSADRTLSTDTRSVALTDREYALLDLLARHPGTPLSRGEIFDALWASDGSGSENVADGYVGYLRKKLSPASDFGFEIKTLRNRGFCLDGLPPRPPHQGLTT